MLKKFIVLSSMVLSLCAVSTYVDGAESQQAIQKSNANIQEKIDIMEEDESGDTDPLAIPFDESNVEDEIQIDQDEGVKYTPPPAPVKAPVTK